MHDLATLGEKLLEATPEPLKEHRRFGLQLLDEIEAFPRSRYAQFRELDGVAWKLESQDKDPKAFEENLSYPVPTRRAEASALLVVVNGHPHLEGEGVHLLPAAEALDLPAVRESFMQGPRGFADNRFSALLLGLWRQAWVLYVPEGQEIPGGVRVLHLYDEEGFLDTFYLLVVAERLARVEVIREIHSLTLEDPTLAVHGVDVIAGEGAHVTVSMLQHLQGNAYFADFRYARSSRDARIQFASATVGSRKAFIRNLLDIQGEGSENNYTELFQLMDAQVVDVYAELNHAVPAAQGEMLSQAVLSDQARKVFEGMIRIRPGAQKSNAFQADHNLMLSSTARADSIPSLEIQADDVRATHSATVGKLDEEKIFYLQSRGLSVREARYLMALGYFGPTLSRMPSRLFRERVEALLTHRWEVHHTLD